MILHVIIHAPYTESFMNDNAIFQRIDWPDGSAFYKLILLSLEQVRCAAQVTMAMYHGKR